MTGGNQSKPQLHPAERVIFFTDAVVAIAMTLLILPLMESVSDAAGEGNTLHWLAEHTSQLLSFVLSFVITGVFWRSHHRLFEHVKWITPALIALDFAWMFTIVWLPVATALTGAMNTFDRQAGEYDRVLVLVYIGTLVANSLLLYLMEVVVRRTPETWHPDSPPRTRVGEAVALSMTLLFASAAVIAMLVPQLNMAALFVLFLTGPLTSLIQRRMKPSDADAQHTDGSSP